jgi:hypothetical protein
MDAVDEGRLPARAREHPARDVGHRRMLVGGDAAHRVRVRRPVPGDRDRVGRLVDRRVQARQRPGVAPQRHVGAGVVEGVVDDHDVRVDLLRPRAVAAVVAGQQLAGGRAGHGALRHRDAAGAEAGVHQRLQHLGGRMRHLALGAAVVAPLGRVAEQLDAHGPWRLRAGAGGRAGGDEREQ